MVGFKETKVKVQSSSIAGTLWFTGWLFTLGFLKLTFWKGVLALVMWPYYLGSHFGIACEQLVQ